MSAVASQDSGGLQGRQEDKLTKGGENRLGGTGFEPVTFPGLRGRSNQLSYPARNPGRDWDPRLPISLLGVLLLNYQG